MIPTIGLVVFGYVLVRMLELASNPQTTSFVRVCAVGLMIGTVVAGIVLVSQSVQTTRALNADPYGSSSTYGDEDTTAVIPVTELPYDQGLRND